MSKNTFKTKKHFSIYLILIPLLIANIFLIVKVVNTNHSEQYKEVVINRCEDTYNDNQKYYTEINFKKLESFLKDDKVYTIAVVDNSSKTYNMFIETINKIAYYNNSNIYLLELSKLTKKNEIAFYDLDDRLKKLESGYLMTINKEKIISITSFNEYYLNVINESIK